MRSPVRSRLSDSEPPCAARRRLGDAGSGDEGVQIGRAAVDRVAQAIDAQIRGHEENQQHDAAAHLAFHQKDEHHGGADEQRSGPNQWHCRDERAQRKRTHDGQCHCGQATNSRSSRSAAHGAFQESRFSKATPCSLPPGPRAHKLHEHDGPAGKRKRLASGTSDCRRYKPRYRPAANSVAISMPIRNARISVPVPGPIADDERATRRRGPAAHAPMYRAQFMAVLPHDAGLEQIGPQSSPDRAAGIEPGSANSSALGTCRTHSWSRCQVGNDYTSHQQATTQRDAKADQAVHPQGIFVVR